MQSNGILRAALAAAIGLWFCADRASAAVLNAPLQPGDIITVNNNLNSFSQIRNSARVGGAVTYGANDQLGGVFTDPAGGLYFAGNPNATGLVIERVGLGQTTSTPLLRAADLVGGGATPVLRDAAFFGAGDVFVLYTTGAVDRFTPGAGGTYTRTPVGTFTGFTSADRGSGHQLSVSPDGRFLITSSRSQNRVWAMDAASGAVQQWTTPSGLLGPVTGTQLTASAESALDPVRLNRVIVPMGNDGLYEIDFDPLTGTFPTATPRRLSSDTVAAFVDAVGFDEAGNLDMSLRDTTSVGSLRELTQAQLAAASGGTPFTIFGLPTLYSGSDARIARDLVVIVPEPASAGLLALGLLGLLARRSAPHARYGC